MRINGTIPDDLSQDALIDALKAAPSAFSFRTIRRTDIASNPVSDTALHRQGAIDAFKTWEAKKDNPLNLAEALERAQKTADAAHAAGNPAAEGAALQMLASFASKGKQPEVMVEALRKARAIHEAEGHHDRLIPVLGGLYSGLVDLMHENGQTPELQAEFESVIAQSTDLWPRRLNEPLRTDAHRVEQGEIGFSANEPMGTDNVCDCLAVIVRDPVTKKTALAHVDAATGHGALKDVFDRMPKPGPQDPPLQVRLVGSSQTTNPNAKRNLSRVISSLQDQHVDILSADVLNEKAPSTFVVDPKTFEVKEAFPARDNPDRYIATGIKLVTTANDNAGLRVAFDLTASPERAAIPVTERQAQQIEGAFMDAGPLNLHHCYAHMYEGISPILPTKIEMSRQLGVAYKEALAPLLAACEAKMDQAAENGLPITDAVRERMIGTLKDVGLHIGAHAERANQPLMDYLQGDFLSADGHDVTASAHHLREFTFDKQPFAAIERESGQSSFQSRLAGERAGRTLQSAGRAH